MDVGRRQPPAAALTGADREPDSPPNLLRVGATLLRDNLLWLVAFNLAGAVVAAPLLALGLVLGFIPLVFLGAGALYPLFGGLIGAAVGELRGEPGGPGRRFLATIREGWRPLILLGLFANGSGAAYLVSSARVLDDGGAGSKAAIVLWLLQGGFVALLLVLLTYALPLAAAYGAGVRSAFRNAVVLAISAPLPTLGMVGLLVALAMLTLWVGLGMWLITPVVAAVFVAANCHLQVERLRPVADCA